MWHNVFNLSMLLDTILGVTLEPYEFQMHSCTPLGRLAKLKFLLVIDIAWARSLNKLQNCFVKQNAILIIKLVVNKRYTLALCGTLHSCRGSQTKNRPLWWEIERERDWVEWGGEGKCGGCSKMGRCSVGRHRRCCCSTLVICSGCWDWRSNPAKPKQSDTCCPLQKMDFPFSLIFSFL